jgi:hypothetical protein
VQNALAYRSRTKKVLSNWPRLRKAETVNHILPPFVAALLQNGFVVAAVVVALSVAVLFPFLSWW